MRFANHILTLGAVFLMVGLSACMQQKDEGGGGDVQASQGKIEQQNLAPGCVSGTIAATPGNNSPDLKLEAWNICVAQGLDLFDLQQEWTCNGPVGDATYVCCPAPPPPPMTSCLSGEVGDGVTCQDIGGFKLPASDVCMQSGLMLLDLVIATAGCPDGLANKAVYDCGVYADVCP